jgi:hypothetical protein
LDLARSEVKPFNVEGDATRFKSKEAGMSARMEPRFFHRYNGSDISPGRSLQPRSSVADCRLFHLDQAGAQPNNQLERAIIGCNPTVLHAHIFDSLDPVLSRFDKPANPLEIAPAAVSAVSGTC